MAHKIGIVTKNLNFFSLISKQRRSDVTYEMELIKNKDSLTQMEGMKKVISTFIFDSSLTKEEILVVANYIKSSPHYKTCLIFLAFENFDVFQSIIIEPSFSTAKVINMPATAAEIYTHVVSSIELLNNKDAQKAKGSGTISSASFLNVFIEATMGTLKEMASLENITFSPPNLLDYQKMDKTIAIRGKLAIKSTYFTGSFFISFPEDTYLKICSKILYEEVKQIDKGNEDLASELCNIVYGKSKVAVANLNMKMDMVIPSYDRCQKLNCLTNVLVVKLMTEVGDLYVKVAPGLL